MRNAAIVGAAAVVMVTAAVVEGMRTNRWGPSADTQAAARKLDRVPANFGDWVGHDSPIDEKIMRVAEATGTVSRQYVNRKTNETISVLLLCGPVGPIGAHTPDVCYGGLGYSCKGSPSRKGYALASGEGVSFWAARFEKATPTDSPLRVFWGWSLNGTWEAAANPRTQYALHSVLYKLYLVQTDNPTDRPKDANPEPLLVERFMTEFLPIVKNALTES